MPLAFTQEDFLVQQKIIKNENNPTSRPGRDPCVWAEYLEHFLISEIKAVFSFTRSPE